MWWKMFERRCALSTRKDKAYLKHILDAISDIKRFMKGLTKEEFFGNKEKQYAVLRALEIIGEATKNLSKEMKAERAEIQWSDIAGMRDKLIHQYFGVNLDLVWETVKKNLPELENQISEMLRKTDEAN
jgi:uncharacterized protein with HEPN domain